jgi:hypothetical protein
LISITVLYFITGCAAKNSPAAPVIFAVGDTSTITPTITSTNINTATTTSTVTATNSITVSTPTFTGTITESNTISPTPTTTTSPALNITNTNTTTQTATVTNTSTNFATTSHTQTITATTTSTTTATVTQTVAIVVTDSTYVIGCDPISDPDPQPTMKSYKNSAAQIMKATKTFTITNIEVYAHNSNAVFGSAFAPATGNIWAEIQGVDGNGIPDGVVIAGGMSNILNAAIVVLPLVSIADIYNTIDFTFAGCDITAGQDYSVVFKWDSPGIGMVNFPHSGSMTCPYYADGYALFLDANNETPALLPDYYIYQLQANGWYYWQTPNADLYLSVSGYE